MIHSLAHIRFLLGSLCEEFHKSDPRIEKCKKKKTVTISSGTHYYFIVYNLLMLSQKLVNHSNRIDPTVSLSATK